MALTKPTPQNSSEPSATVKSVGTFEAMDESTTTAAAANEPTTTAPAAAVPAVQSTGAMQVSKKADASAFAKQVTEMKGAADFGYGNFDVFKGISGNIKGTGDNKANLGRYIQVSMIAWDDRVQISPGSDATEAKNCVGYSADGITLDSVIGFDKYGSWVGKPIAAYLSFLQSGDWPKASASRYLDVACAVHGGESKEAKAMAGEIICVSLSKSSIPSFSKYQQSLNVKAQAIQRGGALADMVRIPTDPFTFYFVAEPASKDGKDWTKLAVSDKLPEF